MYHYLKVCATVGTQHWVYKIKNADLISLYKPFSYVDSQYGVQQAGFMTKFNGYLNFATIHHAGIRHSSDLY